MTHHLYARIAATKVATNQILQKKTKKQKKQKQKQKQKVATNPCPNFFFGLSIYIYKTEAFEAPTIFHISIN